MDVLNLLIPLMVTAQSKLKFQRVTLALPEPLLLCATNLCALSLVHGVLVFGYTALKFGVITQLDKEVPPFPLQQTGSLTLQLVCTRLLPLKTLHGRPIVSTQHSVPACLFTFFSTSQKQRENV